MKYFTYAQLIIVIIIIFNNTIIIILYTFFNTLGSKDLEVKNIN